MLCRDIVIIGAGIIGLAAARELKRRFPDLSISVLEKEENPALHQSSRNSGVLHSGIYYKPNSLKAKNCIKGKHMMEEFCAEHNIPFRRSGKIIVASDESELGILNELYKRGTINGVRCELIDRDTIKAVEPYAEGVMGIWVPDTGVVNFGSVCFNLYQEFVNLGGEVIVNACLRKVNKRTSSYILQAGRQTIEAGYVISCAGLHADKIARMFDCLCSVKIFPFKGEYYKVCDEARYLCRSLIYPVPNLNLPFLGVHFTRRINGTVDCGPNAIFAWSREAYKLSEISAKEAVRYIFDKTLWRLARRYKSVAWSEFSKSIHKDVFVGSAQKLIPTISAKHLERGDCGIRALCISKSGQIIDDYVIARGENSLHILNAPSPAATSSLSIAKAIGDMVDLKNDINQLSDNASISADQPSS